VACHWGKKIEGTNLTDGSRAAAQPPYPLGAIGQGKVSLSLSLSPPFINTRGDTKRRRF